MVEQGWKKRFEQACEKKAKDVLIELGNEYELKYKQLELQLFNANEEIARLKDDKGEHDEALKKAFMRGVCALNMEAMSVLLKNENELETTGTTSATAEELQRRCCNRKLPRLVEQRFDKPSHDSYRYSNELQIEVQIRTFISAFQRTLECAAGLIELLIALSRAECKILVSSEYTKRERLFRVNVLGDIASRRLQSHGVSFSFSSCTQITTAAMNN